MEIRKGLALDPSSAYAHEVSCWFDAEMGRPQEGIIECSKSVELDPLSLLYNDGLAQAYYNGRDYTQAIEQANKTLEINPSKLTLWKPLEAHTSKWGTINRRWSNGSKPSS